MQITIVVHACTNVFSRNNVLNLFSYGVVLKSSFPYQLLWFSSLLLYRRLETLRRKERSEAHLYLTVEVYEEDDFQSHQGADLVDFETAKPRLACQCMYMYMYVYVYM